MLLVTVLLPDQGTYGLIKQHRVLAWVEWERDWIHKRLNPQCRCNKRYQ